MVTKQIKPFHRQCKCCHEYKDYRQFSKDGRGSRRSTCRSCMSELSVLATHTLKSKAIQYLGGQCSRCGIKSKILDIFAFHHTDPNTKIDTISNMINNRTSFDILRYELDKCDLLCLNCHAITHYELRRKNAT